MIACGSTDTAKTTKKADTENTEAVTEVKLEGMDSAYMYVVQNDGTMLYHPTKEKVGQPVENAVIKGVKPIAITRRSPYTSAIITTPESTLANRRKDSETGTAI